MNVVQYCCDTACTDALIHSSISAIFTVHLLFEMGDLLSLNTV